MVGPGLGGNPARWIRRQGVRRGRSRLGLLDEPPDVCQVLVPVDRQVAARGCWTFPRERSGVRQRRSPGSPPCTTIADTAIDLCASVDQADVEDVLTRAVQGRRVSVQELLQCAQNRPRLRHRQVILALLGEVREGAESVLELRYLNTSNGLTVFPPGRASTEASAATTCATFSTRSTRPSWSSMVACTLCGSCGTCSGTTGHWSRARYRSGSAGTT